MTAKQVVLIVGVDQVSVIGIQLHMPNTTKEMVVTATCDFDLDALTRLIRPDVVFADFDIDQVQKDSLRKTAKSQNEECGYLEIMSPDGPFNEDDHPTALLHIDLAAFLKIKRDEAS